MKLNRLIMASAICLTLSAPSAFASEPGTGWLFSFFHHNDQDHSNDTRSQTHNSSRECDQNGQNSGTGRNCDHGKGNGGGYCGTGGSTSGGGTSTGGSTSGGSGTVYK